jgi:hypothetical protein
LSLPGYLQPGGRSDLFQLTKRENHIILIMVNKMEFIREIRRVEDNTITIQLPENYRDKEVEVLVLPFEDSVKSESFKIRSFESLKHISLDTRNYKFNREELHER